jgi:capsular exopolysaccharide synthesis family protein
MDECYLEEEIRESQINLRDYWMVLLKRKWTVLAFAVPLFAVVTIYSFVARATYAAKGTLLIEKEPNILTFEEVFRIETLMDDYYQTQFKLLQSQSLAENVIEKMKLGKNAKFAGKLKVGAPMGGIAAGTNDVRARSKLIEKFQKRLAVKPIRQTRLVEIQWKDSDPRFAAEVVNALFDSFIDMNVELKYETTEQATEFLTKQIASLQAEIEEKQREMQKYGAEKNIIALSETETTIVETLGELNRALTEAQIDRLRKEAYYNEIKNASPENIPDAMTNLLIQKLREDYARMSREYSKKSETFKPDYPEMVRLKTELDSAKRLLENETNNLIKTAYSDYQAALKRERSLSNAYNNQKQEAIQLNSNSIPYNSLKIEIENRKSLLESLIKRESETGVAARLRGLRTSNVRIVDRAKPPLYPSSPRKKLNMLLALMMGLFGGVGLAFLFEYLDNSVKNHVDVDKATGGMATLGVVPAFAQDGFREHGYGRGGITVKIKTKSGAGGGGRKKRREEKRYREREEKRRRLGLAQRGMMLDLSRGGSLPQERKVEAAPEEKKETRDTGAKPVEPEVKSIELITYLSPKSNLAESYRTIRTSLLLSSADKKPKVIVVTSALPEEGKSATLSNLAVTLAQAGKRVLIMDTDFRKPTQHKIFQIRNEDGLTDYLTSDMDIKGLVKATMVPSLFLANVGPVPPNPAELLGSERMGQLIEELKQWFDFVLLDSPPVLTVSDAMVLGTRIDGVILVVWGGKTAREALKRVKEKLDMLKIKCLGVVINNISIQEHDYYYMHQYYHYGEGTGKEKANFQSP